jgi:hypothetical protein
MVYKPAHRLRFFQLSSMRSMTSVPSDITASSVTSSSGNASNNTCRNRPAVEVRKISPGPHDKVYAESEKDRFLTSRLNDSYKNRCSGAGPSWLSNIFASSRSLKYSALTGRSFGRTSSSSSSERSGLGIRSTCSYSPGPFAAADLVDSTQRLTESGGVISVVRVIQFVRIISITFTRTIMSTRRRRRRRQVMREFERGKRMIRIAVHPDAMLNHRGRCASGHLDGICHEWQREVGDGVTKD